MPTTRRQKAAIEAAIEAEKAAEAEREREKEVEPEKSSEESSEASSVDSMVEEIPQNSFEKKSRKKKQEFRRKQKNRPGQGRPVLGPKHCHKCGALFKDSGALRNHDRYHTRNKMVKCIINKYNQECGHMMITDDTESCPGNLKKSCFFNFFFGKKVVLEI